MATLFPRLSQIPGCDCRINRDAVIAKVKELLKGHHDLIVEFSYFFQEGYGGALAFYNGLEFGNKIKVRHNLFLPNY